MQTAINAFNRQHRNTPPKSLPQRHIASIFDRLSAQFGGKLADLYAGVSPALVQTEWAAGLAGFSKDELVRGVGACRTKVFAPTLGEFAAFCRPALNSEVAWHEAQLGLAERAAHRIGAWTHPAVFRSACLMSMEIRAGEFKRCRNQWRNCLDRELALGFGEAVPPPVPRLAKAVKTGPPSLEIRERIRLILSAPSQT